METPLTTPDGFPRNDIDVAQSTPLSTLSPHLARFVLTVRPSSSYAGPHHPSSK